MTKGKKHRGKASRTYVPEPEPSAQAAQRMEMVMQVMQGTMTVTEAAEQVGLSRNRFQVLYNRARAAMGEALEPQAPGRPKLPEEQQRLQKEVMQLRRQKETLERKVNIFDRMLWTAADVLNGKLTPIEARARSNQLEASWPREETSDEEEEPEPVRYVLHVQQRFERLMTLLGTLHLDTRLACALVDVSTSTARRWRARDRRGLTICKTRGPRRRKPTPEARAQVEHIVRQLGTMVGAESLRRSTGLTRRAAASAKAETLREMERERQAGCMRVEVSKPRVVRGFDQLCFSCEQGGLLLIAADAAVPFRTTVYPAQRYTDEQVRTALERDIAAHGAPLVYRFDRHLSHRSRLVTELLANAGAFALHGPPRYPQYYGQTERQNRENRAYVEIHGTHVSDEASRASLGAALCVSLNGLWRRPALAWRTAAEVWADAPGITDHERSTFREQVYDHLARLTHTGREDKLDPDLAMRLAIEKALKEQGFLRIHAPKSAMAFSQ